MYLNFGSKYSSKRAHYTTVAVAKLSQYFLIKYVENISNMCLATSFHFITRPQVLNPVHTQRAQNVAATLHIGCFATFAMLHIYWDTGATFDKSNKTNN